MGIGGCPDTTLAKHSATNNAYTSHQMHFGIICSLKFANLLVLPACVKGPCNIFRLFFGMQILSVF